MASISAHGNFVNINTSGNKSNKRRGGRKYRHNESGMASLGRRSGGVKQKRNKSKRRLERKRQKIRRGGVNMSTGIVNAAAAYQSGISASHHQATRNEMTTVMKAMKNLIF